MKGNLTSVDLVNWFGELAQTKGREMCLTTQENFRNALDMARKCDLEREEARKKGKELPFMHGIPFSVKDYLEMEGFMTNIGLSFMTEAAETNAAALQPILLAGGIPFVRGNVPQAGASIHASNMIWGEAKNSWHPERSAGGSSGGDGSMVNARIAPIAIGTDIGGSIRIPAHFNGIVGFKPTGGRISQKGIMFPTKERFESAMIYLYTCAGPLARSVRDCVEFFKL